MLPHLPWQWGFYWLGYFVTGLLSGIWGDIRNGLGEAPLQVGGELTFSSMVKSYELSPSLEGFGVFLHRGSGAAHDSWTCGAVCGGAQHGSRAQGRIGFGLRDCYRRIGARVRRYVGAVGFAGLVGYGLFGGEVCGRRLLVLSRDQEVSRTIGCAFRCYPRCSTATAARLRARSGGECSES